MDLLSAGTLSLNDAIRRDDDGSWRTVSSIPKLKSLANAPRLGNPRANAASEPRKGKSEELDAGGIDPIQQPQRSRRKTSKPRRRKEVTPETARRDRYVDMSPLDEAFSEGDDFMLARSMRGVLPIQAMRLVIFVTVGSGLVASIFMGVDIGKDQKGFSVLVENRWVLTALAFLFATTIGSLIYGVVSGKGTHERLLLRRNKSGRLSRTRERWMFSKFISASHEPLHHYDKIAFRIHGEAYEVGLIGPPDRVERDILLSRCQGEKTATEFIDRVSDFTGLSVVQIDRPIMEGAISDKTVQAIEDVSNRLLLGAKIVFVCGTVVVIAWVLWMFGTYVFILAAILLLFGIGWRYLFGRIDDLLKP